MQIKRCIISRTLLTSSVALCGCASTQGTIHHVVMIELKNDSDQSALLSDCDRLLSNIPGVTSYWGGTPGDFDRSDVDSDYDVALCIGFDTDQAYAEYLVDPAHLELVSQWKPQFEWIRIHDVLSATP
jgi:hypothetical protein